MADPFLAEIRLMATNFPPEGWATCDGQLLPISQFTALFALLGTTYGGNGTTIFALPNLGGAVAAGMGQGPGLSQFIEGETIGSANVTLTTSGIPAHNHAIGVSGSTAASLTAASSSTAIGVSGSNAYGPAANLAPMGGSVGGGLAHNNLQPYLVLTFCIALQGIFPAHS
jgi:microcystin-dependent protein